MAERLSPEREAWLRQKPAHYHVHEVWPELDRLRAKLAVARQVIEMTAQLVDPECPDVGAYADGHCSLPDAVRGYADRTRRPVAQCTACDHEFWRSRDVPDEWQCSCGGLVRKLT